MGKRKTFNSRALALAAIGAALGVIFLTTGAYTGLGEFFWYFAAGVCVMVTFSAQSALAAILSFAACALLSLLTTGFNFVFLLPYFLFFGPYPVMLYINRKTGIRKWIYPALACLWFDASLYVFYLFTKLFVTDIEFINDNIILLILLAGSLIFLLYFFVMNRIKLKLELLFRKRKT